MMPANGLPPRPSSLRACKTEADAPLPEALAVGALFQMLMSTRWQTMAQRNPTVPRYSTPALPICSTVNRAVNGPTNAPNVPPAAMKPNNRLVCSRSNISSRKLQNTDTSIRLRTLIHT